MMTPTARECGLYKFDIETANTQSLLWCKDIAVQIPTFIPAKGKNIKCPKITQEVGDYFNLSLVTSLLELFQM